MKIIRKASFVLLVIGMFALVSMMIFVCIDIVTRYVFAQPIPGSNELVSMLLSIACFFAFALTQFQKRNITIPIIIDLLGPRPRAWVDAIIAIICAAFTLLIVWQTYEQGISDANSHAVTPIMTIPVAPFKFFAAFASIFLFLAFLADVIESFIRIRKGADSLPRSL